MNLHEFSTQYRVRKPRKDDCGDLNIVGKRGGIYEYDDRLFCATILHCPNSLHWNKFRTLAIAKGLKISQNGDEEGTFLFDPANPEQAKLAIAATRQFKRRILSPEQREVLSRRLTGTPNFVRKTQIDRSTEETSR